MRPELAKLLDSGQKEQTHRKVSNDWHTLYFSVRFDSQVSRSWLTRADRLYDLQLTAYGCVVLRGLLKPL